MAGHSQFKNIMHRKGAQDKKRAKVFTKLIRELTVAARTGLPDPAFNPRLRSAIAAAKVANMPLDNVNRAIKKATGSGEGESFEEVRYEGYGPGGIAVIVEVMTDNRNRSASTIRSTFTKYGGNLGETNSVSFMFDHVGQVEFPLDVAKPDAMFEAGLEAGAEDVTHDDEVHQITCASDELNTVREALAKHYGDPTSAKLVWRPKSLTAVDEGTAQTLLKFLDLLDENDDVQTVYANYDIAEDVMEKLAQG